MKNNIDSEQKKEIREDGTPRPFGPIITTKLYGTFMWSLVEDTSNPFIGRLDRKDYKGNDTALTYIKGEDDEDQD